MEIDKSVLQFRHPFTAIVAGPTSSGKTFLVREILSNHRETINRERTENPLRVLWCYGIWQSAYKEPLPGVEIVYTDTLPEEESLRVSKPDLIVCDDMMNELKDDTHMSALFTRISHHLNISIIFIVQNLFFQGKQCRNISLNAHYIILMKNVRDKNQVTHLARQFAPGKVAQFIDAFNDATSAERGYIRVDLTPQTPDRYRIQTNIIPSINGFAPIIHSI